MAGELRIGYGPEHLDDAMELRWQWLLEERGRRNEEPESYNAEIRDWVAARPELHHFLVAYDDDVPVGVAWMVLTDRIPGPERHSHMSGVIHALFVPRRYRDHDVASVLMDRLMDLAKELRLDYLTLQPAASNFEFFRRRGFGATTRSLAIELDEP